MLFDAHIHCFPDKLLNKVFPKLSEIAKTPYYCDERLDSVVSFMQSMGGTHALALHIATNPKQQTSVNDFAAQTQSENILCFGSVHHKSDNAISELHRIKELGLKGVKLHPDYQDFMANGKDYFEIYKTCEDLGLMITFHCGQDPYSPNLVHCPPSHIKDIATHFDKLTIIAAHLGGMNMIDESMAELKGFKNVYFDTAFASSFLNPTEFKKVVQCHGADRILFGTDLPWSTIEKEKNLIENAELSSSELDKIYYQNACELFKLSKG